jgi:integrase
MGRRVRGEGSILRRKDGRWEGKLRVGMHAGKAIRKSFYGDTRRDVAEQMRDYKNRHVANVHLDLTVAEHTTEWLAAADWRPNTHRLRQGVMEKHVIPYIGGRPVAELDVDDVKYLLRRLKEENVGVATRKLAHVTLNAALNVLYRERKLVFNPCSLVSAPRYEVKEKFVLDRRQAMTLMEEAEGQTQVLIVMAATLAMREGELFGLLWDCIDLERRSVTVIRQLTEDIDGKLVLSELKTKTSRRTLELPDLTHRVLSEWRAQQGACKDGMPSFVFTDSEGNPLRKSNFIRRTFKPLLRRIGLPNVSFHSLRHSSNSLLIEAGADPLLIARRNGHASTRMVLDRYGHLFEGARRQAAETMDRVFAGTEIGRQPENGRQMVVKTSPEEKILKTPIPQSLAKSAKFLVEMSGFEPLTPYMRSKCSTN